MASILYRDLKMVDYRALHHRSKFKILSDILRDRFPDLQGDKFKICQKIFYYHLENHRELDLMTIQKNNHLEKGYIFSPDFKGLGKSLSWAKARYVSDRQEKKNKIRYKKDSKGVYFLIDKKRLDLFKRYLKKNRLTAREFFTAIIDEKLSDYDSKKQAI